MEWKSKYFTLEEMTASATAKRKGINNTPSESIKINLQRLVKNVLDPLREEWGAPIIVTSGYRSVRLNAAVGGARSSQHVYGQAADIRTVSDRPEDTKKLRDLLIKLNLPYDQVIDEFGCDWIHVSHKESGNRGQLLSAKRVKGKTVYTAGIK
jgi:uncharacterized protein YcbK (DUF882 family)